MNNEKSAMILDHRRQEIEKKTEMPFAFAVIQLKWN